MLTTDERTEFEGADDAWYSAIERAVAVFATTSIDGVHCVRSRTLLRT